jgi:hypothetical protein
LHSSSSASARVITCGRCSSTRGCSATGRRPLPVDRDEIFADYRSTVGWPSAHFWRELAAAYPQAKVILTVQPEAAWWASFSRTIPLLLQRQAEISDPHVRNVLALGTAIVVEQTMRGRPDDEATARAYYRQRIAKVMAQVAPERLLVFDVAEGWEPRCRFLGLPVPDALFPRTNSVEEFWDPSKPGGCLDPIT